MSDALVKLIDKSLLPASIMVIGKFLGLVLVISLLNIDWDLTFTNSLLSVYPVVSGQDLLLVSSFSDIFMLIVILGGYGYFVLQAVMFHDTHINPRTVVKLIKMNLVGIIKNTSKVYYSAGVWMIFSIMAILLTLLNVFQGKTYWWIGIAAVLTFVFATGYLVKDIEEEIDRAQKNLKF